VAGGVGANLLHKTSRIPLKSALKGILALFNMVSLS
jgi:hypothetical protein